MLLDIVLITHEEETDVLLRQFLESWIVPRLFPAPTIGHPTANDAWRTRLAPDHLGTVADRGRGAKVQFQARRDYFPFRLRETSPVVRAALAAAGRAGWEAATRITNGGLDANWLVRHKVPTITFGAGQNNVHTVEEFVDLNNFLDGCRYALALARHVRASTRLPMTVLGGAGSLADISRLFAACGVIGAAAGSLFVFKGAYKAVLINYPNQAQKDELIRSALSRP